MGLTLPLVTQAMFHLCFPGKDSHVADSWTFLYIGIYGSTEDICRAPAGALQISVVWLVHWGPRLLNHMHYSGLTVNGTCNEPCVLPISSPGDPKGRIHVIKIWLARQLGTHADSVHTCTCFVLRMLIRIVTSLVPHVDRATTNHKSLTHMYTARLRQRYYEVQ